MSLDALKEVFSYCPDSGVITRDVGRFKSKVGPLVLKTSHGYIRMTHNQKDYQAAKFAFAFMGVNIPQGMTVDHIDGDRSNNVFANLRLVTKRQNDQNKKRHRLGGLVGAYKLPSGRYCSTIRYEGVKISLGTYDTELEAHEVYMLRANEYDREARGVEGTSNA